MILKKALMRAALLTSIAIIAGLSLPAAAQTTPDEANKKGDQLYKQSKYHEAIEAFKLTLNMDPHNDHALQFISLSYNKLDDKPQTRQWMKRRAEIPGLSPSIRAQVLTDIALVCWDQADLDMKALLSKSAASDLKSEDMAKLQRLLNEGIDSAQKAVAIAARSAKAFNLLNLLYRTSAAVDSAKQDEIIAKANEALRQAIQIYQASTYFQQSTDIFVAPTISVMPGVQPGQGVKLGKVKKSAAGDFKDEKGGSATVEIFIGSDGKVRLPRLVAGDSSLGKSAIAAARQYEFEPSTFEGHRVQVIDVIVFPDKRSGGSN
jgi:hypothetical protein